MNFIHVDYLVPVMVCGHHLVLCDPWYNTFPYLWFPASLESEAVHHNTLDFIRVCFGVGFLVNSGGGRGWTWYCCISFSQNHWERSKQSLLLVLFFICLFCQMLLYLLLLVCFFGGKGGGELFSKAEMRFQVLRCLTQTRKILDNWASIFNKEYLHIIHASIHTRMPACVHTLQWLSWAYLLSGQKSQVWLFQLARDLRWLDCDFGAIIWPCGRCCIILLISVFNVCCGSCRSLWLSL